MALPTICRSKCPLSTSAESAATAIAGAVIVLTGHWATTDEMIADLIAGGLVHAVGIVVLLMWSFQRQPPS